MYRGSVFIEQMAGDRVIDPVLLDPGQCSLSRSLTSVHDDETINALLYPSSGLSAGLKFEPVPFPSQIGRAEGNLYPLNAEYHRPLTPSNPVTDTSASSSSTGSLTTPSSLPSTEDIPREPKKSSASSKNKTARAESTKQQSTAEKTAKSISKTRRQPSRETTRASSQPSAEPKGRETRNRRQRSLERNRVAASKSRKRKKRWTDNLEQKRSGLESIHHQLQTEYVNLRQESSQLKNYLISHASCQDANIDVWINNEASKYARTLHPTNCMESLHSVRSLGKNVSTSNSSSVSPGGSQEPPGLENEDLQRDEYSGNADAFERHLED